MPCNMSENQKKMDGKNIGRNKNSTEADIWAVN